CVVATSAALLLQITHAPSVTWHARRRNQASVKRESRPASAPVLRARIVDAITPAAISTATKRWVSCNQIWNAVTSDKARASRHELISARFADDVSGITAPYASGKSRIERSRC